MYSKPIKINKFEFKPEEGINPYIGFMSFQHFRDEKLYSDSIVIPENNMTETEPFECYPVPEDVEENGRQQGYYPDSAIAYIRILWKEFEPERGKYNYALISDIISQAKSHGQSLIFRLMPHSTRARDDVPEWLKDLVDCPQRPDGKRVKDSPTDPLFIKLFSEAIRNLGERFDKEPVFDAVDISLPGSWGEGHNLHLYKQEDLKELIDTYIDVFESTQIIGQISKPELINYAGTKAPVGWRGDGLGDPYHIYEYYPPLIEKIGEVWKKAPVSFEAYWWLGEWKRHGWNIDEIIEKTLSWHISSFNAKSLPIPNEWKDKIEYWISKMGYHFTIDYFCYPASACQADEADFEIGIDNLGVAPIYKRIPFKISISNDNESYEFDTDIDIRRWLPGKTKETFKITLPENISKGTYDVKVGIYNDLNPIIYLCTNAERSGSFYKVAEITVENK